MSCRGHAAAADTSVPEADSEQRQAGQSGSGSGWQTVRTGCMEREGSKTIPMGVDNGESFQMKAGMRPKHSFKCLPSRIFTSHTHLAFHLVKVPEAHLLYVEGKEVHG